MVDRPLADLHLTGEGVVVLGIQCANGTFLGAPTGATIIRAGDLVLAYGKTEILAELATRTSSNGDAAHEHAVADHVDVLKVEAEVLDHRVTQDGEDPLNPDSAA